MEVTCRFTLSIGIHGSQEDDVAVEVPDDFYSLPEEQQLTILHEEWKEWIWNYIDGAYDVVEDGD